MKKRPYLSTLGAGLGFAVIVAACSSGSAEPESATNTTVQTASEAPAIPAAISSTRLLDPDGSTTEIDQLWPIYYDFAEFASDMDVVFVGAIIGTEANAVIEAPDLDSRSKIVMQWDGVVFAVDEVLSGELPKSSQMQVTVVQPTVMLQPAVDDGTVKYRAREVPLRLPPIEVLEPGVRAVETAAANTEAKPSAGQRYLVFAKLKNFVGDRALTFYGPGSVAEVNDDGSLVATNSAPFDQLTTYFTGYDTDITLDVIRKWINGNPPLVDVPDDVRPKNGDGLDDGQEPDLSKIPPFDPNSIEE